MTTRNAVKHFEAWCDAVVRRIEAGMTPDEVVKLFATAAPIHVAFWRPVLAPAWGLEVQGPGRDCYELEVSGPCKWSRSVLAHLKEIGWEACDGCRSDCEKAPEP
jgi:hypothetical protein